MGHRSNVRKNYGPILDLGIDEASYLALEYAKIRVQLDGPQSEAQTFCGFGFRSPLIANAFLGRDFKWFYIDAAHPKNPQTSGHRYAVDRSRNQEAA
jgi:hypothetical protein